MNAHAAVAHARVPARSRRCMLGHTCSKLPHRCRVWCSEVHGHRACRAARPRRQLTVAGTLRKHGPYRKTTCACFNTSPSSGATGADSGGISTATVAHAAGHAATHATPAATTRARIGRQGNEGQSKSTCGSCTGLASVGSKTPRSTTQRYTPVLVGAALPVGCPAPARGGGGGAGARTAGARACGAGSGAAGSAWRAPGVAFCEPRPPARTAYPPGGHAAPRRGSSMAGAAAGRDRS